MLYIVEMEQFSSGKRGVCVDLKVVPSHRKLL